MPKLSQKPGFLAEAEGRSRRAQKPGFLPKSGVRMQKLSQKPGFLDGWAILLMPTLQLPYS
ncbi:hypothetical protein [Microcoleus sp. B9-D4]|uniref:hypothetical protein n=1 Tax=Microcoleus sp. B9-D4 TaxID=2818711 RepID=UPI002FD1C8D7